MRRKLYVTWQSPDSRRWYTIGLLTHAEGEGYVFRYVRDALEAQDQEGFHGIAAFPEFDHAYHSDELFSFFQNRILSPERPAYEQLARQVGLPEGAVSETPEYAFEFLRRTKGWRATDMFELFAPVEQTEEGYRWDFFTRGVRHLTDELKKKWRVESPEEPLRPLLDLHNPYDKTAILIVDQLHSALGFVPGNYSPIIGHLIREADHVELTVLRQNKDVELDQKRFLVELVARVPRAFELAHPDRFEPLAAPDASAT